MNEKKEKAEIPIEKKELIAKRDFLIVCNDYNITIKNGDDINKLGIPDMFMQNLRTEKVI